MSAIGTMAMPADFRYRDVFLRGRPVHDRCDSFRLRHPEMDPGRRAKIFAPFDALRGFNEAVSAKDEVYGERIDLLQEDSDELSRRLTVLHNLTFNSRMARANHVTVSVTFYEPCTDENHEAFGRLGRYRTVTGICRNVDDEISRTVTVDRTRIPIGDILKIESAGDLFRQDWDQQF